MKHTLTSLINAQPHKLAPAQGKIYGETGKERTQTKPSAGFPAGRFLVQELTQKGCDAVKYESTNTGSPAEQHVRRCCSPTALVTDLKYHRVRKLVRDDRTTPPRQAARPASRETAVYLAPLLLVSPGLRRAQNYNQTEQAQKEQAANVHSSASTRRAEFR